MLNTFITSSDFNEVARILDRRRLIKQALEVYQILNKLELIAKGEKPGYGRHPAVLQWQGYEECLKDYFNAMKTEILRRGYTYDKLDFYDVAPEYEIPWFVKSPIIHKCHEGSLLRKDPDHYEQYFKPDNFWIFNGYLWPSDIKEKETIEKLLEGDIETYLEYCRPVAKGVKIPEKYL